MNFIKLIVFSVHFEIPKHLNSFSLFVDHQSFTYDSILSTSLFYVVNFHHISRSSVVRQVLYKCKESHSSNLVPPYKVHRSDYVKPKHVMM